MEIPKDIKYNDNNDRKNKKNHRESSGIIELVKGKAVYFVAGLVLILLIGVFGIFLNKDDKQTMGQYSEDGTEEFQVNAYPDIIALIARYYACYAVGDFETMQTFAKPFSAHELAYMELLSQYVESYQNMTYYTKSGLDAGSYMVNVYLEMKFEGVETLAPGLDFFYVRTNEEGELYIDNSYSEYNMDNNENPLDMNVHNLIIEHEQQKDVIKLFTDTTAKFNAAIESDENLYKMVNETIPDAASEWMKEIVQGSETEESEVSETEVPDSSENETEIEADSETESESEEESETASESLAFPEGTIITIKEATKVRKEMTTESDVVTTLYKGEKVTVVMSYTEGWTKVKCGSKTGYIRTDLLQ